MPAASSFAKTLNTPFIIYTEEFGDFIGRNPRLELTIVDDRAPYFYSGGAFISRIGTLFLTSNLLKDSEPSAAPSAYKRTEITKIDFYSSRSYNRDKVRCPEHSYMAAGVAEYPSRDGNGLIVCAQGSLKEPSGLVYIDTKRPHKSRMLLNNFQGRPFNSPCDIVSNPVDGSVYFTDPAYGYERGHRPKPELPTGHIYRFEPETGECRVVANGHIRPAGLALSPNCSTLYISELGDKYGGTTIFAYTVVTTDPFRKSDTNCQISVSSNNHNTHRPTPSSSTSGSNSGSNNSQNGIRPSMPPTAFNRTQPLTPRATPTNGHIPEIQARSHSRGRSEPNNASVAPAVQTPTNRSALHLPQRPAPRGGPFLVNKRLFAYTTTYSAAALISTAPSSGHLFLGTEAGVEVFSSFTGDLIGKIMVDDEEGLPIAIESSSFGPKSPRDQQPSHHQIHPALRHDGPSPSSLPGLASLSGLASFTTGLGDQNHHRPELRRNNKSSSGGDDDSGGKSAPRETNDNANANSRSSARSRKRKYQRGVSKVAFGLNGEFWLLGGERLWKGVLDLSGSGPGGWGVDGFVGLGWN